MTTFALFECIAMWIFIALNIVYFYKDSPTAAYLLVPYLLWVCVAAYLNFYVVMNNPDPYFEQAKVEEKKN